MKGRVAIVGYPDVKLSGQITQVAGVPQSPGKFEARVAVEPGDDAKAVAPGMACSVKITAYRKNDALTVPETAVFSEGDDDDAHYVFLAGKGAGPERRLVKVGKSWGGKTVILEGLHEGDEILTSKAQTR
jgi:multidrug efflux pump subunit AcrA (membrane-fusion protein)